MNVLIATDGTLDPEQAAQFAVSLAGPDGTITVLTVVEINRNLLRDLRGLFGERLAELIDQDAEYVGLSRAGEAPVGADWPGDDKMLGRYLHDQLEARTGDLVAALVDAEEATVKRFRRDGSRVVLEPENPDYQPMVFEEGVEILGRVVAVLRSVR